MKKLYFLASLIISSSVVAQTTARLPLVEGLTSNTCGPCAGWNSSYGPIIEANRPNENVNPGIAVVKYQMDWPSPGTDPSFNADGDTRRGFYGTTGIPDWYIDGMDNNGTQAQITSQQASPAELSIQASYTLTGNTIDVTVRIVPLVYLGNGNRCYIALTNKSYNYSGGTNGENQFKHVVRKMLPNGAGTFLSTLNANDTIYINESYTYNVASGTPAQGSYDLWNSTFEVVAWVQRTTGAKEVRNAAIAPQGTLGIVEGDKDDFGMLLYPNPSSNNSTLVFDADGGLTTITIYNQLGEVVKTEQHNGLNGRQNLQLDTSPLTDGIYFVQVQIGENVASTKMIIQK